MRMPTAEEAETALKTWAQTEEDTAKAERIAQVKELLPRLDWHQLWSDEEEEEWLLYPLIPARRLIALFSAAKVGKSLLMLEIAAGLSTGRKVLGHDPGRRIRVLYVDFENDPRGDVRTRLQDMGYEPGSLDWLDYLSFPSLPYLDSEIGASSLLAAVEAYGPELVVIDTISRAVKGEENDNDTWLNLYKHTGLALKKAQVAMIRLDHTGKDEAKGQRGGSAKSGDVDAIWKLTTVVRDQRYQLTCLDSRFSLDAKELTLLRHDHPLHHSLQDSKPVDDREAKIQHAIELADQEGVDAGTGRDKLKQWGVSHGLSLRNDAWSEVVKRRKQVAELVFDPGVQMQHNGAFNATRPDETRRTDLSPPIFDEDSPQNCPPAVPMINGNEQKPLSELSPSDGDRLGAGPTSDLSPHVPPYKGDSGTGDRDSACSECGWWGFHKAVCKNNPNKRGPIE